MIATNVMIRRMRPEDLVQVHEIDRLSFTMPWPKRSFNFELNRKDVSWCWVAELDDPEVENLIVGMAVVWLIVDEAHIATFAVHPDYRAIGVGKRLFAKILSHAKQSGIQTAILDVRETNKIAQKLYSQFGFQVTGRRKRYYMDTREDALIMAVSLAD
jgi:ribosomal-protein-alanine N-acetyltransferase